MWKRIFSAHLEEYFLCLFWHSPRATCSGRLFCWALQLQCSYPIISFCACNCGEWHHPLGTPSRAARWKYDLVPEWEESWAVLDTSSPPYSPRQPPWAWMQMAKRLPGILLRKGDFASPALSSHVLSTWLWKSERQLGKQKVLPGDDSSCLRPLSIMHIVESL